MIELYTSPTWFPYTDKENIANAKLMLTAVAKQALDLNGPGDVFSGPCFSCKSLTSGKLT